MPGFLCHIARRGIGNDKIRIFCIIAFRLLAGKSFPGGGAVDALGTVATIVGVCVMGASYIWGIGQTKQWLKENGTGNIFTVLGKGTDALLADMSKSFSNAARDAVAAVSVVALWPVSLVLLMLN